MGTFEESSKIVTQDRAILLPGYGLNRNNLQIPKPIES